MRDGDGFRHTAVRDAIGVVGTLSDITLTRRVAWWITII